MHGISSQAIQSIVRKPKMKKLIVTLSLLVSAGAFAQAPPPPEEIMKQNDKNKDGVITKAEAEAAGTPLAQFFDQLDTNKDGKLTMEELKAMAGPP
jgi:Ca2+-binding EF-hand superfamily protein